jgi:AcrR family transcriptional regulator
VAKPKGKNSENRDATHASLVAAGKMLFEERGYAGVTTLQIARQAGVAEGSLFHHFASKHALFIEIYDQWQNELIRRIDSAASAAKSPAERFRLIWGTYLESTRDPAMRQILLLDGPAVIGLDRIRERDRQTAFRFFHAEIETMMNAGLLRRTESRPLAILLFGALDQAAFEIADFPLDFELRDELSTAFQNIVDSLA